MYQHHIEEMVEALVRAGAVPEEGRGVATGALEGYWADRMAITWHVSDVATICPGLEEDECREVLNHVLHHNDVENGVTWDDFEVAAQGLFGERALEDGDKGKRGLYGG